MNSDNQRSTITAIETRYKGYRCRSRLEARWMVFFDALGIRWEYEPQGFLLPDGTPYLPDFWLPDWKVFAEVKPEQLTPEEFLKSAALNHPCLLLDGSPESRLYFIANRWEQDLYDQFGFGDQFAYYLSNENWGRVILDASAVNSRPWFSFSEGIDTYWTGVGDRAVMAARAARFEHGETPR